MTNLIKKMAGVVLLALLMMSSCKEDNETHLDDTIIAKDFIYNLATKKMSPDNELNGTIQSEAGIKLVYYYLLRDNANPVLVHTEEPVAEQQYEYHFKLPNSAFADQDMAVVKGLKIMIRHLDNSSSEGLVNVSPFTPARPAMSGFPGSLTPELNGAANQISGNIVAESGIEKIDVYDDRTALGNFELVESIAGLNGVGEYTLNYNYVYAKRANQVKIVVTDGVGVTAESIVNLNVVYPTTTFSDVFMTAHSTGTNTIFVAETGTTLSNCNLNASESNMAFLYYGTGTGPAFYSPTNTTNVAKNFKCNGVSWEISNPAALRATRFRVLLRGSSDKVDQVYSLVQNNEIEDLDDSFFTDREIAAPMGSSARFDAAAAASATVFNLTDASLIYVRIPDFAGSATYKNALIKVKEATSTTGTSTIKFDIIVQK
jgi:hypothetical protein